MRTRRGENCVDESWSATTASPNTVAITPIIAVATTVSRVRASSGVPSKTTQPNGPVSPTSIDERTHPMTRATTPATEGSSQRAPRPYSRKSRDRRQTVRRIPGSRTAVAGAAP